MVRKAAAKYIYQLCEKLGPTKILSGTRDITERVLQVGAAFATDGPADIRYTGNLNPVSNLPARLQILWEENLPYVDGLRRLGFDDETISHTERLHRHV